jgi:starch synthase
MSLFGFLDAIKRGLDAFRSQPRLAAIRKAAMNRPRGWSQAAAKYRDVYRCASQTSAA